MDSIKKKISNFLLSSFQCPSSSERPPLTLFPLPHRAAGRLAGWLQWICGLREALFCFWFCCRQLPASDVPGRTVGSSSPPSPDLAHFPVETPLKLKPFGRNRSASEWRSVCACCILLRWNCFKFGKFCMGSLFLCLARIWRPCERRWMRSLPYAN